MSTRLKVIQRRGDQGYLDRWLWVPKPYVTVDAVKTALTHVLSDSYTGAERILYLWKETRDHLLVPRAFWDPMRLAFPVVDCRPQAYPLVEFGHRIKLDHRLIEISGQIRLMSTGKSVQKKSVQALYDYPGGVLQLACGKGKTVIALYKIATGRVPAIVMVDNTNLLYQWKKEAERMLDVPGGVGIFGDGKKEWRRGLVLATYHSVANWSETITEEERAWFGQVFWDEGHHVSAPIFAKTADMFYGNRYSLTATPERDDGLHVVADVHVGPVLFKDLTPTMTPNFAFYWTGLEINLNDPTVRSKVLDSNQEVHLSRVNSFFGSWMQRLQLILDLVNEADNHGRRILVLSNSVDEVVNLMAMYELGAQAGQLYTDIPIPTPQDVGETLTPAELTKKDQDRLGRRRAKLEKQKKNPKATAADIQQFDAELAQIAQAVRQHEVHRKIVNLLARRQREYVKRLVELAQQTGLLTYDVPPKTRQDMLRTRRITFAVTKYGKEGMDCPELDTVILSSLFSSRNGLQQLMGRPTRPMPGKKTPTLLALVDNVGQCIGMSKKLVQHLREWPRDEGGPYNPYMIGYPRAWNAKTTTLQSLFGQ